jgi:hypothetical protein
MPSLTMPIVLAALSLMTRSNYVSCSTGDVGPASSPQSLIGAMGTGKLLMNVVPAECRAIGISR